MEQVPDFLDDFSVTDRGLKCYIAQCRKGEIRIYEYNYGTDKTITKSYEWYVDTKHKVWGIPVTIGTCGSTADIKIAVHRCLKALFTSPEKDLNKLLCLLKKELTRQAIGLV